MNHQPRIVVLITQNQSYRFLEINHYTFSSVMIIHYVSLFSNAIRFSSWKTRHGQTPSHPVRHSVFKERVLNDKWEEKSWKSVAERRKSERHVDWQGEEGAGRRENAFEDEMGPEETVNPLARGLSSATFLFSHSTSRLLKILKNPKKKKKERPTKISINFRIWFKPSFLFA